MEHGVTITISDDRLNPLLKTAAVEYEEGETAFDILLQVTEENGIAFDYEENPDFGAFIKSFGHLVPEGDDYWGFFVNGVEAATGISSYELQNGDNLLFKVTSYPPETVQVTVSATGLDGKSVIPETSVSIVKGGTAYDALIQAALQQERSFRFC